MMAEVKIPLPSLLAVLSNILKLQIDETQLKKIKKETPSLFSLSPL